MQLHILNRLFQKMRIFFSNCGLFRLIFFIVFTCLSTLLFLFSNFVLAGNVRPPVVALSDSIKSGASFDGLDEFGLHDHTTDQNFSLSSDLFGVSGPLSFSVTWSDQYDLSLNMNYARLLNARNAYAIEASLGVKSNRLNLTVGHAFSSKNRLKLTVERLAQKQSFDFDSGSIDHWVSQYAGGAEFQHLLEMGMLNNIAVGGYYARALDKTLDPVLYDSAGTPWINFRHIAGASSKGFNTSIGIRPWKTGIITLVGYYDFVHYHHLYENVSASDSSQLGFGLSLNQYLSSSMQGNLSFVYRATYKTIQAGIQWLHNIFHQTRSLAFSLSGSHSSSENVSHDNSVTVGMQYYFAPVQNVYRIPEFHLAALKNWTSQPAVRMDQVLAAADQMSEKAFILADANLFSFTTSMVQDKVIENIHWGELSTNIPNAELEYHLSIFKEPTNYSNNSKLMAAADIEIPVIEDEIVNGHDYVDTDVEVDKVYKVKLNVIEKTTGFSKQYVDYFQVSSGSVYWPDGFNPEVVYLGTEQDQNKIRVALYFSSASSDQGFPVEYKVTATNDSTQEIPLDHQTYSDDDMKNGAIEFLVTPSQSHTLEVIPVVGERSYDKIKQQGSFTKEPSQGVITWTPNFQLESQGSTSVRISWSQAIPAYPSIEDMEYTIVLQDQDGSNTQSLSGYTCDEDTQTCAIDVTGLTPGRSVPPYVLNVTAHDKYDKEQTESFSFTTVNGAIEWTDPGIQFTLDTGSYRTAGTITWNDTATLPGTTETPTYVVSLTGDNASVDTDTQQCSNGTCTVKVGVTPGGANYKATITVKADNYNDLSKSYTFDVDKGDIEWTTPNIKFTPTDTDHPSSGSITWNDTAIPSVDTDAVTYSVSLTGDGASVDSDTQQCSGGTCSITASVIPGESYQAKVTATTDHDNDLSKTTSFSVDLGKITWNGDKNIKFVSTKGNLTTGVLSWSDVAEPTLSSDTVTYSISLANDTTAKHTPVVSSPTCSSGTCSVNVTQLYPGETYSGTVTAADPHDEDNTDAAPSFAVQSLTWNDWAAADNIEGYAKANGSAIEFHVTVSDVDKVTTTPDMSGAGVIKFEYKYTKLGAKKEVDFQPLPSNGKITIQDFAGVEVTVRAYINGYEEDINSDITRTITS